MGDRVRVFMVADAPTLISIERGASNTCDIEGLLARQLERSPLVKTVGADPNRAFDVRLTQRAAEGWFLRLSSPDGVTRLERVLSAEGTCSDHVVAAALIIERYVRMLGPAQLQLNSAPAPLADLKPVAPVLMTTPPGEPATSPSRRWGLLAGGSLRWPATGAGGFAGGWVLFGTLWHVAPMWRCISWRRSMSRSTASTAAP